ncbi:hypothetical protein HA402_001297 [Bradysia odoriphaga]|nr:hypothetical protein HA402_001297 [Bradysia odoriphaga]
MIWTLKQGLCVLILINTTSGISSPEATSYVAGVVEYQVDQGLTTDEISWTSDQMFQYNTEKYIDILYSVEATNVDILVFPENTLNRQATAVIIPKENEFDLDLCTNTTYNVNLRNIACAAKSLRKYVVINLTTKWQCIGNDSEQCTDGWELYNTNVVLNRDGVVISIYRKFNLFGELGITQPNAIELKTFDTDFGVRFGHFVCFDLMFESPGLKLVRDGVKNIVFPTRWYSELPFITAIQMQQNWAHVNDVNFLAAGANLPILGTTGSGIYSGKLGTLTSIMTGDNSTKLLVHEVPKVPGDPVEPVDQTYFGSHFDDLTLYQDEFDGYSYSRINPSTSEPQIDELCSTFKEERLCCRFNTTVKQTQNETMRYEYMAVVYNGWRHFNHYTYEGVKICAIVACENEHILSCGKRLNNSTEVSRITFVNVSIDGNFSSDASSTLTMPTSLDFNISSLPTNQFAFQETQDE